MSLFSDFPDLKLLQIINNVTEIAIAETRDLVFRCPSNVICIIESMILLAEGANNTINSVKVDDVEVLALSFNQSTSRSHYATDSHGFTTTVNTGAIGLQIPMREKLVINVTNTNAGANDLTTRVWAFVHNDDDKEYHTSASHGTISPTAS